jgi:membrane protein implicated in regulation of membrane protease activity
MSVRETYDLPERTPVPHRHYALMLAVPAIALALWVVLPNSPVTVALLALVLLTTVFVGVGNVMRSRELHRAPGRHPVAPPSAE